MGKYNSQAFFASKIYRKFNKNMYKITKFIIFVELSVFL